MDAYITVGDEDVAAYFETYFGSIDYAEYGEQYGISFLMLVVLNQAVMDYLTDDAILE